MPTVNKDKFDRAEIAPNVLASKTRSLTAKSKIEDIDKQLNEERFLMNKIKRYMKLLEDFDGDFNEKLSDVDQRRYYKMIFSVFDSKSSSQMTNDKNKTYAVLKQVVATRSRYLGRGFGGAPLFLSSNKVITRIDIKTGKLIVVWPSTSTLTKQLTDCELRVEFLVRLMKEHEDYNIYKKMSK